MIADHLIQELKYRNEIESVVSSYVALKRRGRNLTGICPFHSEKTPSFTLYPDNQSFFCFGCGAGGDVVTFIRRIENLSYPDALRFLAKRVGMELPEDGDRDDTGKLRMKILEMNRTAAHLFHKMLIADEGRPALEYLARRGLSPGTIRRFGLGFAPESWDFLLRELRAKGYSEAEIEASALAVRGRKGSLYDSFRGRVIFPIIDLRGSVIGFGGRALEGTKGPKYLNSPDTPVYKKSRNLFALNFAKGLKNTDGTLILAEGYMDVIALHQAGFEQTVATLGTALTAEQARLIAQYASGVVLAYDSDSAGQTATKRAIALLDEAGVKTKVLKMTGAKDPDEYIQTFGAARFRQLLDQSDGAVDYEIGVIRARYDLEQPEGRVGFLKDCAQYLAARPSPIERDVYAARLGTELNVSKDAIIMQIDDAIRRKRKETRRKQSRDLALYSNSPSDKKNFERNRNVKSAVAEERLLACMLKDSALIAIIADSAQPEDFSVSANRVIYEAVLARFRQGLGCGLTELGAELDVDEIGRLSGIMAANASINFSAQDVRHYLDAMRDAKEESDGAHVGQLEETEYLRRMRTAIDKKKKQGD